MAVKIGLTRKTETLISRSLLVIFGTIMAYGAHHFQFSEFDTNFREQNTLNIDDLPLNKVYKPLPWTEVKRVTNPTKNIDGVIVKRPFGDDFMMHLYLVPTGKLIETEHPYNSEWAKNYLDNVIKVTPFVGYKVEQMSIHWKNDLHLDVYGKVKNRRFYRFDNSKLVGEKEKRIVKLDFHLDID